MPHLLQDLEIDRVDLVDAGANSAAFIQIFKRRERENMDLKDILSKMLPEHAEVVQKALDESSDAIAKAKELCEATEADNTRLTEELAKSTERIQELEKAAECGGTGDGHGEDDDDDANKGKTGASFDEEEVLKSLPEAAREIFAKERAKREAAEEVVRKAAEETAQNEAVAKAATLKALPVAQEELVELVKNADEKLLGILTTVNAAIEAAALGEIGKSGPGAGSAAADSNDAWAKIEQAADKISVEKSITKQRAIAEVIKEQPELYKEYLETTQGGVE